MIRAKFRCETVTLVHATGQAAGALACEIVKLSAVYGKEGSANAQWSKWTPAGTIEMQINNPDAFGKFVVGGEYYVDFTPAT